MKRGLIFCNEKKINRLNQFSLSATGGIHWWQGATAIFIMRANKKILEFKGERRSYVKMENMKNMEVIAWTRKYFRVASEEYLLVLLMTRGMKAIRLISKKIHLKNREFEDITLKLVKKIIVKKRR